MAQTIFFNNVGFLNMCVHGTIGIAATLAHLGRIDVGYHRLETPVGDVTMHLRDDGSVEVENVPSYRSAHHVRVETDRHGVISGDIAWGGNWFFLAERSPIPVTFANVEALTDCAWDIRCSLTRAGIAGADGGEIDHIELFGPPERDDADSKNFVLCPGKAYDRSPCGTGTSAKMACLAAAGALEPGALWRQESIVGSRFVGRYDAASFVTPRGAAEAVVPRVRGSAHVTADMRLLLDPERSVSSRHSHLTSRGRHVRHLVRRHARHHDTVSPRRLRRSRLPRHATRRGSSITDAPPSCRWARSARARPSTATKSAPS